MESLSQYSVVVVSPAFQFVSKNSKNRLLIWMEACICSFSKLLYCVYCWTVIHWWYCSHAYLASLNFLCMCFRKYGFVFLDLEQRKMNGSMFVNVCDSVLSHVRPLNVLLCFLGTSFFAFRCCHFKLFC
jgi:hypothetical protein